MKLEDIDILVKVRMGIYKIANDFELTQHEQYVKMLNYMKSARGGDEQSEKHYDSVVSLIGIWTALKDTKNGIMTFNKVFKKYNIKLYCEAED